MTKTRAERRHNDVKKALRKRKICLTVYQGWEFYKNLHQYSKNKVHCSCPMCQAKTNPHPWEEPKGRRGGKNWKISDLKKIDALDFSEREYAA
jgi:hypothetical protein